MTLVSHPFLGWPSSSQHGQAFAYYYPAFISGDKGVYAQVIVLGWSLAFILPEAAKF